MKKKFLVFRVSENSNSFGLKQFYAMAEDGQTFHACANSLNTPKKGDILEMTLRDNSLNLFQVTGKYELLTHLEENAPQDVIEEVYGLVQ